MIDKCRKTLHIYSRIEKKGKTYFIHAEAYYNWLHTKENESPIANSQQNSQNYILKMS